MYRSVEIVGFENSIINQTTISIIYIEQWAFSVKNYRVIGITVLQYSRLLISRHTQKHAEFLCKISMQNLHSNSNVFKTF